MPRELVGMLYKLVAILALAIAIFHFTGGKNTINVDGISTKMTSRSVVTAVHALTMAETSYRFKFKTEFSNFKHFLLKMKICHTDFQI